MLDRLSIYLILLTLTAMGAAETAKPQYRPSLRFSCFDVPFLSVSVHAPRRDSFPNVEMHLVDPLGRHAGSGARRPRIPKSQSGKIAEIPPHPDKSKAVA